MPIGGPLTRSGGILIANGGSGAWDEGKLGPLNIIKMGATDYRMWYEGFASPFVPGIATSIGYATSSDGITWTKDAGNPIFVAAAAWENNEVSVSTVIWDSDAGVFKMWYHGGHNAGPRQIGLAYSSDGLTWTRQNSSLPVLPNGGVGTWDEKHVADASVIRLSSTDYRMWYLGVNASDVQATGYATSTDGISWTKYGSNPVFQSGTAGQWDDGTMYGLRVFYFLNTFHGWYTSDDGSFSSPTTTGIGYASSPDATTWTRGASNPVLRGITSPEEWISDPIFVYREVYTMRIVYYDDDFSVSPANRVHRMAITDSPSNATVAWLTA